MSFELIHTSVPRDLDGQSGFGVAAMTRDLPRPLREALVARSDGSELDASADRAISYAVCHVGGSAWPVLTCVTRCGADWSGRANRVAHHLVLEPSDRCAEGPIALARLFRFATEVPEVGVRSAPALPQPLKVSDQPDGVDPAWFDLLAERLSAPDASSVAVRLPHGLDPLVLLTAITARVEPRRRWAVQWSTAPAFHAGRGLPSIVIAREHDATALDLAQRAPIPDLMVSAPALVSPSARPRLKAVKPITARAMSPGLPLEVSASAAQSSHSRSTDHASPGSIPRATISPLVPILMLSAAGVIMIVALGLLLW
jgi:hypothetical protein